MRFVRYWIAKTMEDPETLDARNKAHLDKARFTPRSLPVIQRFRFLLVQPCLT
jgi:hypothetical protein